jgi:hypothetical protein
MTSQASDAQSQAAPRWRVRLAERSDCVDVSLTLDADGSSLVLELTDEQATLLSRDLILAADRARFAHATRAARIRSKTG